MVDFTFNRRIGQHARSFLERRCRQERIGRQAGFSNTQKHSRAGRRLSAVCDHASIFLFEIVHIDLTARQKLGIAASIDLDLAQHLSDHDLDMFIININTL